MICLDTSAIYALADGSDPNHSRAVELFGQALHEDEEMLVHSYILVKATALLQRRLGTATALRFLREADTFVVHWIGAQEHQKAVRLLDERGRRDLSLVDCASFAVMQAYRVDKALAFDPDFEREGFGLYTGPAL